VPGRGFEAGKLVDVSLAEVVDEAAQGGGLLGAEAVRAEQLTVGEEDQPLDLDEHARAVQSRL